MHVYYNKITIILRHGPLSRLWCMRFEAKNSYFKRIIQAIGNFKNVAKTSSIRQQRLSCYHFCNDANLFHTDSVCSGKGMHDHQFVTNLQMK